MDIINIVDLVRSSDFYGGSEEIEIAKGKYQAVDTWKDMKRKLKRMIKWQLKKK